MSDHLSAQGRPDPRGGLPCFQCPKKNLDPYYCTTIVICGTLKIVKNILELRKLWPPKVEGVKNSEKQTTKQYKA